VHILTRTLALAVLLTAGCSTSGRSDGTAPLATYSRETGRLETLSADVNKNGKIDTVSYMDGTRILRIELDLDENGHVERWDFYRPDGEIEKVGFSRLDDGIMDAQAFYGPGGELARMEVSTQRDGRFDRIEIYDAGVLTRSTDDTNGDGRPDKWDEYVPVPRPGSSEPEYAVTATAFDDSGSGRPERRFVYGARGGIERVETDADGDGVFVPVAPGKSGTARH
jgi:hypothetical protein